MDKMIAKIAKTNSIGLIIVLLLLVGVALLVVREQKTTAGRKNTPILGLEKEYSNEAVGISVDYPSHWFVDTAVDATKEGGPNKTVYLTSEKLSADQPFGTDTVVSVAIAVNPYVLTEPAKSAEQMVNAFAPSDTAKRSTVTIGGEKAYRISSVSAAPQEGYPSSHSEYYLDHQGKVYAIYVSTPVANAANLAILTDQIVSTIHFLK